MEFPEKIWILEHKADGKSVFGFEIFNTETDAWTKAVDRAFAFVDIVEKNGGYKGFAFKPNERKAEVYFDSDTFSWEWHEVSSKDFVKGVIKK